MKKYIMSIALLALAAAPLSAQCGSCSNAGGCGMSSSRPGVSVDARLPTLAGDTFDLGSVVGQKPTVITCLGAGAAIDATAKIVSASAAENEDVTFVAVLCDTSVRSRKHAGSLKLSYPVLLDAGGLSLQMCQSEKCAPTATFFNADGEVVQTLTEVTGETFSQGLASLSEPTEAGDPVCGMTVGKASAAGKYDYNGVTYYFCSQNCVTRFKQNPAKYVGS